MSKSKTMHKRRVFELGCIACRKMGYYDTPPELHHVRNGQGMGQRASDFEIIPLCPIHHRLGGTGVAIHAGKESFEAKFGTERELLDQVNVLLGIKGES